MKSSDLRALLPVLVAIALGACDGTNDPDAGGELDAGPDPVDSGPRDSGPRDSGPPDGMDSGTPDGGLDAGPGDGGPEDGGPADAGSDAGPACDLSVFQIGVVRANAGTLYTLPAGTSVDGASWDTCGTGFTLLGRDFQSDGFWLCVPDACADTDVRYFVGNGVLEASPDGGTVDGGAAPKVPGTALRGANVTAWGDVLLEDCPVGALVWDGAEADTAVWVCAEVYEPSLGWEFETAGDLEGWEPLNSTATVSGGDLALTVTAGDPLMFGPVIALDAATSTLRVSIINATSDSRFEVFFVTQEQFQLGLGYAPDRSVVGTMPVDATTPTEITLDMSTNALWRGTIRSLRVDFTAAATGTSTIDYMRLSE